MRLLESTQKVEAKFSFIMSDHELISITSLQVQRYWTIPSATQNKKMNAQNKTKIIILEQRPTNSLVEKTKEISKEKQQNVIVNEI